MKRKWIAAVVIGLVWAGVVLAEADKTIPPKHISVFKVPLVCPAASEIGCGSRAKPILLAFERERTVTAAWLNRPGTLMVIVWRPETKRKDRAATLKDVSQHEGLEAQELKGTERKRALEDFPSAKGWLRGSDVDRLSEEEAGIMASRLIRKIRSVITL